MLTGFSGPPGRMESVISLVATPKKNTMNTPLMKKWAVRECPNRDTPSPKT